MCGSTGKRRFGVVTNTRFATRASSWQKRSWSLRPPTCSTTAFERGDVERAVRDQELAAVGHHGADLWERLREVRERHVPDRGDLLRPGIEGLEEAVRQRLALALAEGRVRDADVDDGCLRGRLDEVVEELQLLPAAAQRSGRRCP